MPVPHAMFDLFVHFAYIPWLENNRNIKYQYAATDMDHLATFTSLYACRPNASGFTFR